MPKLLQVLQSYKSSMRTSYMQPWMGINYEKSKLLPNRNNVKLWGKKPKKPKKQHQNRGRRTDGNPRLRLGNPNHSTTDHYTLHKFPLNKLELIEPQCNKPVLVRSAGKDH